MAREHSDGDGDGARICLSLSAFASADQINRTEEIQLKIPQEFDMLPFPSLTLPDCVCMCAGRKGESERVSASLTLHSQTQCLVAGVRYAE